MERSVTDASAWANGWQTSWDRLEDGYVPDREAMIGALLDVAIGLVGTAPTVLDLGCGTATISRRLLDRFPSARSIAVDVDPVLLAIASATFADDDRVRIVRCDLRDPHWADALSTSSFDAVLTSTALHWLSESVVRRLYQDIAALVRTGGVFAHAEAMPLADTPRLAKGLGELQRERLLSVRADGRPDWNTWWALAAADDALTAASAERRAVFPKNYPTEEFSPPADWHIRALTEAGFSEAGVTWRRGSAAIVAAIH